MTEGLIPFLFVQWRFWKTEITTKCPGVLSGEFLIIYSIARIFNEFFREPDATLILGMTRGQFYSLFLVAGGLVLILISRKKSRSQE
jgi:phosphatidylglycerol:prolipoprotein diacylglycerol transferase